MEILADPQTWLSLATLTLLEIVLGIDNLVFIAVLVEKLPTAERAAARRLGIAFALGTRLLLLAGIAWLAGLTAPVFDLLGRGVSWRDLVLILGGFFLLYKSTHEIHGSLEGEEGEASARVAAGFVSVVTQIAILDIVFSLDSVITAVGMAQHLSIMVTAIVLAMLVMLAAAGPVSDFVTRHPTVKMLALSFLLLIGTALIADGLGFHIPKGYIYAAMGFSMLVEGLNMLARRRRAAPVQLRLPYRNDPGGQ
jgi:predicted tellurium resistance membrane protein TerC